MPVIHSNARPYNAFMLIGGERVESGPRLEVRNPAHPDEVVGTFLRATPEDIDRAVAEAKRAQPAWAARSFTQRAQILDEALGRLGKNLDERAALFVRENGKTLAEAKGELTAVAPRARLTLALATELDDPRELPAPDGQTMLYYVPYGVVVSIVPWNGPVGLAAMQIIPALLAGNSVILKVPETCPLTLIQTAELLADALPAGLLNIVSGLPSEIGDALTTHPNVGKIGFTGSIPSARRIIANAAQSIKGVTAELGGNDPAIILEDADLSDETMQRMATIVFRMTGQVCMAIKRIYVAESLHNDFVAAFGRAVDRITVGDGLKPGISMGPLHTRRALERASALVEEAGRQGAKMRKLGAIEDAATFQQGYFMQPTIVTGIGDDTRLMTEEQFCPAIPVTSYRDVGEALVRANATIFGLGGSVWSRDRAKAIDVARHIQAGTVFVNTHGTQSVNRQAPYGGLKQSGIGRRSGIEGLREYMQIQTLTTYDR